MAQHWVGWTMWSRPYWEKDDGDLREVLTQQVEDDHVFGLKGAGDAERGSGGLADDLGGEAGGGEEFGVGDGGDHAGRPWLGPG
jgi:hypothetical protein